MTEPTREEQLAAVRWGKALTAEMAQQGVGVLELARRTGWQKATISDYRRGAHMPRVARAAIMADALSCPRLLSLCVSLRTVTCEECERTFVRDQRGGTQRRWCTYACKDRYRKRVTYAVDRAWSGKRYDTWMRMAKRLRASVDAMCRSCEPDGLCRQSDCPLRSESPWPLQVLKRA
jgi:transcriptional regulator with XRE-family HTH domain